VASPWTLAAKAARPDRRSAPARSGRGEIGRTGQIVGFGPHAAPKSDSLLLSALSLKAGIACSVWLRCHTSAVTSPWDETRRRLLEWTRSQGESEFLSAQILLDQGFQDLDPSHPRGGKDGGADAITVRDGKKWTMASYFPRGQQALAEIKTKAVGDYKGVANKDADGMAFVTNQELRLAERQELAEAVGGPIQLFHLDRLVTILDQPRMYGVRQQYLQIDAPAGLDRTSRIAELSRASLGRCRDRWQSVGLPKDTARALAQDATVGAAPSGMLPTTSDPVVIWTGVLGSGKSIAAERAHQADLDAAAQDPEAPAPVFLRASQALPDLQAAVETQAAELGAVRLTGAAVTIDGVDELGYARAAELLSQSRTLVDTWPGSTVAITSRPLRTMTDAEETRTFPELSEQQQRACVAIGMGTDADSVNLYGLTDPVKKTLGQPFFALLVGLWMRERAEAPRAPIDLMSTLGQRATANAGADQTVLRRLARLSLVRDFGPVPAGDVLQGGGDDELLASGMVERQGTGLAFVLPAVAQWFAGQSLLLDEITIAELAAAPEDLEVWRYPLALAISLGSFEQAKGLLLPLFEAVPGFAFRVLDTTFTQALLQGDQAPPWREGGQKIRDVMQPIVSAIEPAAQLVADVDDQGRVRPVGVHSAGNRLTVAFWRGEEPRPDVFAMPPEVGPFGLDHHWGSGRWSWVGPGSSWAWEWARDTVRTSMTRQLTQHGLPVASLGPLGREIAWSTACAIVNRGLLLADEIEIAKLKPRLKVDLPDLPPDVELGPVTVMGGGAFLDSRALSAVIAEAEGRGETTLHPPVPPGDRRVGGGSTGSFYTDAGLIETATAIYSLAIAGYCEIVERWLPKLAQYLEHYVLMPMRFHGFLANGCEGLGGPIPQLSGFFEALPSGSESEVVLQMGPFDWQEGPKAYEQQIAARPEAARWLRGGYGGMPLELGRGFPIATVVQTWLGQDLLQLGLNSRRPPNRPGTGSSCTSSQPPGGRLSDSNSRPLTG
jgi:hypothetical protein